MIAGGKVFFETGKGVGRLCDEGRKRTSSKRGMAG
jgi:hypothetical protein